MFERIFEPAATITIGGQATDGLVVPGWMGASLVLTHVARAPHIGVITAAMHRVIGDRSEPAGVAATGEVRGECEQEQEQEQECSNYVDPPS